MSVVGRYESSLSCPRCGGKTWLVVAAAEGLVHRCSKCGWPRLVLPNQ